MISGHRKALQDHLDNRLGYYLEANGAHATLGEISPGVMHAWLLLSILERLESINESLAALVEQTAKEQEQVAAHS